MSLPQGWTDDGTTLTAADGTAITAPNGANLTVTGTDGTADTVVLGTAPQYALQSDFLVLQSTVSAQADAITQLATNVSDFEEKITTLENKIAADLTT